jgi:hypothetical protein
MTMSAPSRVQSGDSRTARWTLPPARAIAGGQEGDMRELVRLSGCDPREVGKVEPAN